jgi:membrane protein insertase Oxa1/YidC/SpoIIIJ
MSWSLSGIYHSLSAYPALSAIGAYGLAIVLLTVMVRLLLAPLPIPALVYLVIPILAAVTTFVQSRMIQQSSSSATSELELQQQQMTRSMQVMMPLTIAYFAFITPAGLGLYWFISNCFSIIQQYFVTGWHGLRPTGAGTRRDIENEVS